MSSGNLQLAALLLGIVIGGALVWMGRPCPVCSVPDNSTKMDSVIAVANAANARADSLLLRPEPKPVTILVHERNKELRGAPVDSLFGILDAMPSAE